MTYRRILVPLDGTGTSQRGLREALALAKPLGATLVLLHVIEAIIMVPEVGTAEVWASLREGQEEAGRRLLDEALRVVKAEGVACESVLPDTQARRVADVIVERAATHQCDLIVMGTHGRRGVRRAILGSDAEIVLRQSPVPVLLVRGRDDGAAGAARV